MFDIFRRSVPLDGAPDHAAEAAPVAGSGNGTSQADTARRELLEQIAAFVCRHDLVATPGNLALVAAALSGTSSELSSAFAARQIAGTPIDQRWLDTLDRFNPASERRTAELELLMEKLDDALIRFAQSARVAQDETHDHRGAIGAQLTAIANSAGEYTSRAEVDCLMVLTQAMVTRLEQIEQAMERSRTETEELRRNLAKARLEADVDHLTGLPNRRAFERRFAHAAATARSRNEPLCVAFCDVDHFKLINDRHGHDAGDRVLRIIAGCLAEQASEQWLVSRHGGEEFVLLLPGVTKAAAAEQVDAMRRSLASRNLINRSTGKPFGKITFSAGIADVTEQTDDRSALIRADAALYQAKQDGRNRIAIG